ncbi:unnamed protein product [Closterium sp. Naga37s-1]|nr:unnamed protein product [Closterium sp. Naga37s-1]
MGSLQLVSTAYMKAARLPSSVPFKPPSQMVLPSLSPVIPTMLSPIAPPHSLRSKAARTIVFLCCPFMHHPLCMLLIPSFSRSAPHSTPVCPPAVPPHSPPHSPPLSPPHSPHPHSAPHSPPHSPPSSLPSSPCRISSIQRNGLHGSMPSFLAALPRLQHV